MGDQPSAANSDLAAQEYRQQVEVNRLRRKVFSQSDPAQNQDLLKQLKQGEDQLNVIRKKIAQQASESDASGRFLTTTMPTGHLGPLTTGLDAKAFVRMAQVPTSICHLLDPAEHPLVSVSVKNTSNDPKPRRVRVTSYIEGYSAQAVDTAELDHNVERTFDQLPVMFLDRIHTITELTRASLNTLVEDLDSGKVEIQKSAPVWLLARTSAPIVVKDPKTGSWLDMTRYMAAYVTPNAQSIMEFLPKVTARHPQKQLAGYQVDEADVAAQVKAIYDALKHEANINYVNSVIDFAPEDGSFSNQRVRLPRESLASHSANCIDGTVLVASLMEAISLNPAIVVIPGHAFVAWETWRDDTGGSNEWRYLETTMIGSNEFEEACQSAESTAKTYNPVGEETPEAEFRARRRSLAVLRTKLGITPME